MYQKFPRQVWGLFFQRVPHYFDGSMLKWVDLSPAWRRLHGCSNIPRQRRALYRMHSYVLDNQTLWNQLPIIVRLESLQKQMLRFPNSKDFINMHILYSMIDYFRQINTPISARIQIGIVFTTFVARSSTTWNVKFSKN